MNEPTQEVTNTQPLNPTPMEAQQAREKEAFIRYTQESGEPIPENFADAGAWFESLKNAQAQYTQGQQEIAELKKQYAESGAENPNYNPNASEETPQPETEAKAENVETLKISAPSEQTESDTGITDLEPPQEVSMGEWNDWGNMIDANNGEVPDALRNTIKMRLNVDDKIIDDYMNQRAAIQQQNVESAANLVGGQQELNKIMAWAGTNLSEDERQAVNGQLAGPGYKTAILGLKARYETSDNVSVARGREPGATPNRTATANAYESVTPYASNQEMFADQRNPRYRTDAKFRQSVDARIIATNQYGYRT